MRTLLFVLVMVVMLVSSGCYELLSVHPLATAETAVFDPGLAGEWSCSDKDSTGVALIRAGSAQKKDYDILWIPGDPDKDVLRLKGQLAKVGDRLVLDLITAKWPDLTVPEHFFMLVEKTSDGVKFHWLDSKWLQSQATSQNGLAHMMMGDELVVTAGSAEIHAFLVKFGLDPQAVSGVMSFKRVKGE